MILNDDEVDLDLYRKGDVGAFDRLYNRYREPLYGYFFNSCKDKEYVDEMFQEVWLRVIRHVDTYESRGKFRQWLFSCAHNIVVDHYRRNQNRFDELKDVPGKVCFESQEIAQRIANAINTLPFDQRQAFHLREQLSCSIREISNIQGCTEEAAKSRLRYAYSKLRGRLEDLL